MKRFQPVIFITVILLALLSFLPAAFAEDYYEDKESGIRFDVFEGWEPGEIDADREYLKCLYTKDMHFIGFAYGDMWDMLTPAERMGYTRSEIDNSIFSEQDIMNMYGNGEVTIEYYGDFEYYVWRGDFAADYQGINVELDSIVAIRVYNAQMYQFQCQAFSLQDAYVKEFKQMLATVQYPVEAVPVIAQETDIPAGSSPAAVQETYAAPAVTYSSEDLALPTGGDIILSLLITVAVYSLPIIIYRYGIRKRPMEKKPARRLTIIYAVCALVVMMLILVALGSNGSVGGAIILWSFINYQMLTRGEDRTAEGERNRMHGAYKLAGRPGETSSGWYPAGTAANQYGSVQQPYNSAAYSGGCQAGQANPYASAMQPDSSVPDIGARQSAQRSPYQAMPPDNRIPGKNGLQAGLEKQKTNGNNQSSSGTPPQPRQDKYDRGEDHKTRRGHEPHKYWRGE